MKWKDVLLAILLGAAVLVGIYAAVCCVIDPQWYFGKTYGTEAEKTLTADEMLAEINESLFTEKPQRTTAAPYYGPPTTAATETETWATLPPEPETPDPTEAPTEAPTQAPTERPTKMSAGIIHYSIDGRSMDDTLQDILYTTLSEYGMEWWMPYAIAQARAESGFNPYAVSKDGKDKGIFQYREKFWAAKAERIGLHNADIFNPVNQIYVYCFEVASRHRLGITDPAQLISAHKTAGYGYDGEYVEYVMGFVRKLQIKR